MESILNSNIVITELMKQGVWAILYVSLYVYTLKEANQQQESAKEREEQIRIDHQEFRKESYEREKRLMLLIEEVTNQYERLAADIEYVTVDMDEIKEALRK